eukprot:1030366-Amphidinium_carterae.1
MKKPSAKYVFQPPKNFKGVRRMMQRPATTKKPPSFYTRCRASAEVNCKYNKRRNIPRDVEGNYFVWLDQASPSVILELIDSCRIFTNSLSLLAPSSNVLSPNAGSDQPGVILLSWFLPRIGYSAPSAAFS